MLRSAGKIIHSHSHSELVVFLKFSIHKFLCPDAFLQKPVAVTNPTIVNGFVLYNNSYGLKQSININHCTGLCRTCREANPASSQGSKLTVKNLLCLSNRPSLLRYGFKNIPMPFLLKAITPILL